MHPEELLDAVKEVLNEHAKQRESWSGERSMLRAVTIFNAISTRSLTERDGWEFMLALKLARARQGERVHMDDYIDMVGYIALLAEHRSDVEVSLAIKQFAEDGGTPDCVDEDMEPADAPEVAFAAPRTCWNCNSVFDRLASATCPECGTHWTYRGL